MDMAGKACNSAYIDKGSLLQLKRSSLVIVFLVDLLVSESSSAVAVCYQCILSWLVTKSCIVASFDNWDQSFKV
jgi:hypothetical protein